MVCSVKLNFKIRRQDKRADVRFLRIQTSLQRVCQTIEKERQNTDADCLCGNAKAIAHRIWSFETQTGF